MTVYIVWFNNSYGSKDLLEIFTGREYAEDYIERHSDGALMEIEERELAA